MKLVNKIYFIIFCGIFIFFAVSAQAIAINPLRQSIVLAPGGEEILELEVQNDRGEKAVFVPEVDGFIVDADSGRAVFGQFTEARAWVDKKPRKLVLAPGEKGKFFFKISIPKAAEPGARYLAFFAKSLGEEAQISISERAGSLIFLYVAGEVREELSLMKFESKKKVYFRENFNFFLELKNTGTIHLTPAGSLIVRDIFGRELMRKPINTALRKVLPNGQWRENITFATMGVFAAGPLQAELQINYGLTNSKLFDREVFWFVPWQIFVFLGFLIFFALILFFQIKKIKKQKRTRRAKKRI